jgi:hypothetical protein
MRYPKGSVVITGAKDIPLLRMVRNCRFVGHEQLFELLQHEAVESSRKSFNWRVRRLLKAGRIVRVNDVFCDGYGVYTVNQNGLLELEGHHEFAIALNSGTRQMPDRAQVFHALELNAIRLSLVRSALLVSWQSEVEISSANMVSRAPYQKDYDAIVKVWLGNEIREFALEYEHSVKNTKQYEKIRAALDAERRVGCILYLTIDADLLTAIFYQLTPVSTRLGFMTSRAFREQLLEASVTTDNSRAMVTLEEFLRYSHPLYGGSSKVS